jgi:hypothetical protein
MEPEPTLRRCRKYYAKLIRLYPKAYRKRFGEGMNQTFNDLCYEKAKSGGGLFRLVLWLFLETSVGIVRENIIINIMQNKGVIRVAMGTGLILLIPLLGNLFVEGWNWGLFDFIVCGALVFGTGVAYQFVARKVGTIWYRAAAALALVATFLLTWVNLAVEIIGDNNPANLLYFAVPIVGVMGATIARFRPM